MENLSEIGDANEEDIVKTLQSRFESQKIYTFSAESLIVLNPNQNLPIYDIHIVDQYKNKTTNSAHIFAIAENAYAKIRAGSKQENIIFSGESGSGKTSNLFHIMRYLSIVDANSEIKIEQLNALQTVLESLGSAKTLKNDIASRFGCQYEMLYKNYKLSGINLNPCIPLETSRIIWQKLGERNFSVFYQLCAGLDPELKSNYGIKDAKNYFYLNQNKINLESYDDSEKFQLFDEALTILDFSSDQKDLVLRILSAILHLGNIFFTTQKTTSNQEFASIGNDNELKWVAHLLEVDVEEIRNFLTQKDGVQNNSSSLLNLEQALDKRDAFAKFLYEELFKWVLAKITLFLSCSEATGRICLFDMFGFERYNNNGYEEFCINLANEKLENLFAEKTIKIFQKDYENEGISPGFNLAPSMDNNKVVELLFRRPNGILPLLDDECKFPKSSDESFLQRCNLNHLNSSNYGKPRGKDRLEFGVKHYAGCVYYNVDGFRKKNYWALPNGAYQLLTKSENASLAFMFKNKTKQGDEHDKWVYVATSISRAMNLMCNGLKNQDCVFIRCIRTNNERTQNKFDIPTVQRQIKAFLIAEQLSIAQFGYVHKLSFLDFARRYRCLLPFEVLTHRESALLVTDILDSQGIRFKDDFQLGSHSVFIKDKLYKQLEEAKISTIAAAVLMIQRNIRKYIARKKYLAKKRAVTKIQAGYRGWKVRRIVKVNREQIDSNSTLKGSTNGFKNQKKVVEEVSKMISAAPVVYIDLPEDLEKWLNRENFGKAEYKTITHYVPLNVEMHQPIVEGMRIEEFAEENIKHHILEARREPIIAPFLTKENEEDFSSSLKIFKLILRYMNDTTMNEEQLAILAKYIIQQGITNPTLRDEIYVQLCNQTYKNRVKANAGRAWNLILMAVNSFPPGILVFPMLYDYFQKQAEPLSTMLLDGLLQPLRHKDGSRSRFYATTRLEQFAMGRRQHPVAEVSCSDNRKFLLEIDSSSTAEEVAERVLRKRGIADAEGWSVVIEDLHSRLYVQGHAFLNDALAQFEFPNYPEEQTSFVSFPCKQIYTHQHKPQLSQDDRQIPTKPIVNGNDSLKSRSVRQLIENHNKQVLHENGIYQNIGSGVFNGQNSRPSAEQVKEQNGEWNDHRPPSVNSNLSTSKRIRNMRIPTQNSDVEKFLDDVFQQALPPVDYDTTSILAASIKGGRRNVLATDYFDSRNGYADAPTDSSTPSPPIMHHNNNNQNANRHYFNGSSTFTPTQMPEEPSQEYASRGNNGERPRYWYQEGNIYQGQNTSGIMPQQPVMMMMPVDPRMWMHGTPSSINLTVDDGRTSQMTNGSSMVQPIPVMIQPMFSPTMMMYTPTQMNQSYEARTPENFGMQLQNGAHENGTSNGEPRKTHVTERYANVLFAPYEQPKSPVQVTSNIKKTAKEARSKSPVLYSTTETNSRYVSPPSAETNGRYASPPSAETNGRYVSPPPMRPYQLKQFQNGQTQAQPQENGNHQYQTSYKETPVYNREPPDFYEKLEKIYSPQLPPKQQQPAYREAPRPYKEPEKVYSPPQPEKIYSPPPVKSPEKKEIGSPLGLRRIPKENYMEPVVKGEILNAKHFNPQKLPIPLDEEESRLAKRQAAYKLAEKAQYMSPPITKTIFERPPQGRNVHAQVEKIEEERESTQHRSRSPEMKVVPSARSQSPPKPRSQSPPKSRTQPEPKKQISEWVYDCDATLGNVQIRSKGGYDEINGTTPTPTQNVPILPEHKKPQASPPPETQPAEKQPPAVVFSRQPWEITIRKEVFLPGEKLEDSMEIDLIFSQIITDCKNPNPYRIRSYEREVINQILYDNRIPKNSLERPYEIPMDCKLQVINTARRWPLYFSRLYAVIEERLNERVFMLLGISETGVRLIARNLENAQDPLIIQDHFEFVDIADIIVEGTKTVTIVTRRNTRIIMSSPQAASIKLFIERFLSGKTKQRTHVIALSDYITKEPNLLSFYKGDIIQIVKNPDSKPPATGVWFYGKLGEKFGWVPADYVKPVEESQYGEAPKSRSDASLLYGTVPRDPRSPITPLSAPYSDYGGFDDQHESIYGGYARTLRSGGGRLTMSEFAINYFRRPKSFGDSIRGKTKKEWTWDEITSKVKYTDKPINHSLLRLESNEADKMAQDTFLCIMRFMGDEALKRGQTYTDCVYELLSVCHRYPPLRDEVYCQIIKQVTSNRSANADSLIKGWRLFGILTAYFDSSEMLKPYLMRYLSDIAIDSRRAYTGSAKICLDNLKHTFQFGGRKFILSASEVEAITMGKSVKRQAYHLPGGHKKLISTKSVTVAEEIVQELCLEMNIRGTAEQHEFCLCYILEKNGSIKILNNDEYIMDVTTELDVANEEYVLLLTRSVWISPLRADSPLYIDVLFFQTVPNYVAGFLNILPKEQLTAALLDDTAIFGALLLLSDPYNRDEILTSEIVQNLIPKSILKRSTITLEQWVGRVENKTRLLPHNIDHMEARRMFLEKLEKWPLFGASFFFVKRVNAEKVQLLEAIVAINKHGIRVLTSDTHEAVLHHTLNEIETTNQYKTSTGNYIDIRLNPNKDNREVISLETENGGEIARVVAHYTYLIKEKDSFYALDRAIASSEL